MEADILKEMIKRRTLVLTVFDLVDEPSVDMRVAEEIAARLGMRVVGLLAVADPCDMPEDAWQALRKLAETCKGDCGLVIKMMNKIIEAHCGGDALTTYIAKAAERLGRKCEKRKIVYRGGLVLWEKDGKVHLREPDC